MSVLRGRVGRLYLVNDGRFSVVVTSVFVDWVI